jgi:D-sedoheptulose 7-phosphate isomerase
MKTIQLHLQQAHELLGKVLSDEKFLNDVTGATQMMVDALKKQGTVFSCGNGGSMCDAMHFAEELSGRYRNDRPAYRAISISDPSHISCVGNDYGFDFIFSRFLEGIGRAGDVLLAITTSGNSKNVLEAAKKAKEIGMKVIALTGKDGGHIVQYADISVIVPWFEYADRIQEIHIKVIHSLIDGIEQGLK